MLQNEGMHEDEGSVHVNRTGNSCIKLEISYLTLYNGECEETRWSLA